MISRKVAYYTGLVFLMVGAGMPLLSWELLIASVPFAVYVLIALSPAKKSRISVKRSLPVLKVIEGESVPVRLTLENRGDRDCFCTVDEGVPSEVEVAGGGIFAVRLPAGGSVDVRYTLRPGRFGVYALGPLRVHQRDPQGTTSFMDVFPDVDELVVFPRSERIRRADIHPSRTRIWMGMTPSRMRGTDGEFHAIRRYVPGDPLRAINWKASARMQTMLTNEYLSEKGGDIVVILDARGSTADDVFSDSVRIADQISTLLLRQGNRVGLIVLREFIDRIYPSHGRLQEMRIHECLLRVRPGGEAFIRDVTWLLTRFFPRGALATVVTPLRDEAIIQMLTTLRKAGVNMLILSPDPVSRSNASEPKGGDVISALAKRLVALERRTTIRYISRIASVIDIEPSVPLELVLRRVQRMARSRGRAGI